MLHGEPFGRDAAGFEIAFHGADRAGVEGGAAQRPIAQSEGEPRRQGLVAQHAEIDRDLRKKVHQPVDQPRAPEGQRQRDGDREHGRIGAGNADVVAPGIAQEPRRGEQVEGQVIDHTAQ